MATKSTSKKRARPKVVPSRRQVRSAIDSGVKSIREGLLAADGEVRKHVATLADKLAGQQPAEVLHALVGELQQRLGKLKQALPNTPAKQRRVREQVAQGIDGLRQRAQRAVAARRTARSAR